MDRELQILSKSQIDLELAKMWTMTVQEAATAAAQAVVEAEAAIAEAESATREAEALEADAEAAQAFAAAAIRTLRGQSTTDMAITLGKTDDPPMMEVSNWRILDSWKSFWNMSYLPAIFLQIWL